jgi:ABC-type branched-subunit amino acid transport system substrate-binding protein
MLLVSSVVLIVSCSAFPASTAPVVRFGLVAPFEGRHRQIGYDIIYAARLAVREWNGRGGVERYRIELVALDDGGDPEGAVRAARSLVVDPTVVAVIGHWLDETTTAGRPVYHAVGLPLIEMSEGAVESVNSSSDFFSAYQAVAPLGEEPGPWALPAYDACNQLIGAMEKAVADAGELSRSTVATVLAD